MLTSGDELQAAQRLVERLSGDEVRELRREWALHARPEQLPPRGDWITWLLIGGRGSGKTRAGAEWVQALVEQEVSPIALVGESIAEAMAVMVHGVSGVLSVSPPRMRPRLREGRLLWPNGVEATVLGANDPERFRGPQFAAAWCDEIAKWPHAEAAWDMLQFGLRLGSRPRQLATTTPRPTRLLRRLLDDPQTVVTRMATAENARNLAPAFLEAVVARYRGTVLGRQELEGELIEDRPDALWHRSMFRPDSGEEPARVVVAMDPPVTGHARSDACGIVVAGRRGKDAVVMADYTLEQAAPLVWAKRAVRAASDFNADCIVAEVNQGGDLVRQIIAQADPQAGVRTVRATRGKWVRAEPVAALYAQGRVQHRGGLQALEDEMCAFGPDGRADGHSPDRVDALVWSLTELMLGEMSGKPAPGAADLGFPGIEERDVKCGEVADVSGDYGEAMDERCGGDEGVGKWATVGNLQCRTPHRYIFVYEQQPIRKVRPHEMIEPCPQLQGKASICFCGC